MHNLHIPDSDIPDSDKDIPDLADADIDEVNEYINVPDLE